MPHVVDKNIFFDRMQEQEPGYVRSESGLGRLLSLIGVTAALMIALAVGSLLYIAIIPYFGMVGNFLIGVIFVVLICTCCLAIGFTWSRIGIYAAQKKSHELQARVVQAGNVVVWIGEEGQFMHLSAMQEEIQQHSSTTTRQIVANEEQILNLDTVMELYSKGIAPKTIAETFGAPEHQVKRLIRKAER